MKLGYYGPFRSILTASVVLLMTAGVAAAAQCGSAGEWFDPESGAVVDGGTLIDSMSGRQAVLLGEVHDQAGHHRWQLHTLLALHARQPSMAIGLEMLPRAAQPVLDEWVNGAITTTDLLERTRWSEVWGFDPAMYLPVFHFARQNRVPMIALNVNRGLISQVASDGWQGVPEGAREGLSEPAPASESYRDALAQIYVIKARIESGETHAAGAPSDEERRAIDADPDFNRFVEAQTTWDRAMAEAMAARLTADADAVRLVVALVGRGHADFGHGIPHQLADLGIREAGVLLPARPPCDSMEAGIADAVFGLGEWQEPKSKGPRLGVLIASDQGGVLVQQVTEQSVAEATGLAQGDVIVETAGTPVAQTGELIEIVQRQAPGTWLPLVVRRNSEQIDLVAKFPTAF